MIVTLDLSRPRKLTQDMINDLLFRYKMRGSDNNSYKEKQQKALICLALGSHLTVNASASYSQKNIDLDHVCKYAELYSIPLIYSAYEIIKAKDSFIHTVLGLTRSSKKIVDKKNRGL